MTINTYIEKDYSQLGLLLQNKKMRWEFRCGYELESKPVILPRCLHQRQKSMMATKIYDDQ